MRSLSLPFKLIILFLYYFITHRSHFPQVFIEAPTYQVLALSNLALVINKVLKSQIAAHDKGYVVYYVYYVCYIIAHSASFSPCLDGGNTTTHHSSLKYHHSSLITHHLITHFLSLENPQVTPQLRLALQLI